MNIKACEQLNAWLAGFQSILNRMTGYNFNWTLHALLFLHTLKVIAKKNKKEGKKIVGDEEDADIDDIDPELNREL